MSQDENPHVEAVYVQLCQKIRDIDDVRTKLLALLPFATGAGIFVLLSKTGIREFNVLGPIGAFGFLVTLGLFAYELHGVKRCGWLIRAGCELEQRLGVSGTFRNRPHGVAGFIDEPFAASVIYPASLAAWAFFALGYLTVWAAIPVALGVFGLTWSLSLWLIRQFEQDLAESKEYHHEPRLFARGPKPERGDAAAGGDARVIERNA
jgi:hypothetical protein